MGALCRADRSVGRAVPGRVRPALGELAPGSGPAEDRAERARTPFLPPPPTGTAARSSEPARVDAAAGTVPAAAPDATRRRRAGSGTAGRAVAGRVRARPADRAQPATVRREGDRIPGEGLGRVPDGHRLVPDPYRHGFSGQAPFGVEAPVPDADRPGGGDAAKPAEAEQPAQVGRLAPGPARPCGGRRAGRTVPGGSPRSRAG
jgi:hypothetical protein